MNARRVKVEGDFLHGRIPDGAIYVGRSAPGMPESPFNNPHRIGKPSKPGKPEKPCKVKACGGAIHTVAESRRLFREHLDTHPELAARARRELRGRDLACWCALDAEWCHADDWLALLERLDDPAKGVDPMRPHHPMRGGTTLDLMDTERTG